MDGKQGEVSKPQGKVVSECFVRLGHIGKLWLPYVIYANTDKNEAVQFEQPDSAKTTIVVTKEGKFVRSGIEVQDKIMIFEGKNNKLSVYQTYTKGFQCQYHQQRYSSTFK